MLAACFLPPLLSRYCGCRSAYCKFAESFICTADISCLPRGSHASASVTSASALLLILLFLLLIMPLIMLLLIMPTLLLMLLLLLRLLISPPATLSHATSLLYEAAVDPQRPTCRSPECSRAAV